MTGSLDRKRKLGTNLYPVWKWDPEYENSPRIDNLLVKDTN